MKKICLFLLCTILVLLFSGCHHHKQEDVIKVNGIALPEGLEFGMKEGEVTQIFGGEFSTYNDTMIYDWRSFEDNEDYPEGFSYSSYLLTVGFTEDNSFEYLCYTLEAYDDETPYDDYYSALEYLKKYYGEPTTHKDTWTDDRYKDDFPMWNKAVQQGHLTMYDEWAVDGYYFRLDSAADGHVSITFVRDKANFE